MISFVSGITLRITDVYKRNWILVEGYLSVNSPYFEHEASHAGQQIAFSKFSRVNMSIVFQERSAVVIASQPRQERKEQGRVALRQISSGCQRAGKRISCDEASRFGLFNRHNDLIRTYHVQAAACRGLDCLRVVPEFFNLNSQNGIAHA